MIPKKGKLTIYDFLKLKGQRQITVTTAREPWIATAAEAAGVEVLICGGPTYDVMTAKVQEIRSAAQNVLIDAVLPAHMPLISEEEAIRGAVTAMRAGADLVYACVPPERVAALAKQQIPCHCHVGLVPLISTWTGGIRAMGKNSQEALKIYRDALAYQEAGAVMIEIECVPTRVATEIAKRLDIPVISIGSGSGCDGQYLFSFDILGMHDNLPRHAKKYRNFYDEAVSAFKEFRAESESGVFPPKDKSVDIKDDEFETFLEGLESS